MIRLAALACGLLCGLGLIVSGLFDPSRILGLSMLTETGDVTLVVGLVSALIVSGVLIIVTQKLRRPLLGGEPEHPTPVQPWKSAVGGLLFGIGWALSGYFPAAALVSLGLFAPGAAIFLMSVLGGLLLHDLVATKGHLRS